MSDRDQLIDKLAAGLPERTGAARPLTLALGWLAATLAFVALAMHLGGPLRPGLVQQLLTSPRFALETAAGLLGFALLAIAGFRSGVPGLRSRGLVWLAAACLLAWLGSLLAGMPWLGEGHPALPPSMAGKRPHCFTETLTYALPPMLLAVVCMRRLFPVRPGRSALLLATATAVLPAAYMQLSCMYAAQHILERHLMPGLIVAVVGALIGYFVLRPRRMQRP